METRGFASVECFISYYGKVIIPHAPRPLADDLKRRSLFLFWSGEDRRESAPVETHFDTSPVDCCFVARLSGPDVQPLLQH